MQFNWFVEQQNGFNRMQIRIYISLILYNRVFIGFNFTSQK